MNNLKKVLFFLWFIQIVVFIYIFLFKFILFVIFFIQLIVPSLSQIVVDINTASLNLKDGMLDSALPSFICLYCFYKLYIYLKFCDLKQKNIEIIIFMLIPLSIIINNILNK